MNVINKPCCLDKNPVLSGFWKAMALLGLIILITLAGCKKENVEPEYPTGWQEGMSGKIVFVQHHADYQHADVICIVDSDGRRNINIKDSYQSLKIYGISWARDKQQLIYGTRKKGIRLVNTDGSDDSLLYFDAEVSRHPHYSHDNRIIAYCTWRQIKLLDQLGNLMDSIPSGHIYTLDWSPIENKIAYSNVGLMSSVMSIYDMSDNSTHHLAGFPHNPEYPVWSPDGNKFGFVSSDDSLCKQIYVCDTSGENIIQVSRFVNDNKYYPIKVIQPAWSPDGTMLAIGTSDGVYVLNMKGEIITLFPKLKGDFCGYIDWQ